MEVLQWRLYLKVGSFPSNTVGAMQVGLKAAPPLACPPIFYITKSWELFVEQKDLHACEKFTS